MILDLSQDQYDSLMEFVPHYKAGVVGPWGARINIAYILHLSLNGVRKAMTAHIADTCRAFDQPVDLEQWKWEYVIPFNLN